ncbi:MAG TPA: hypothetical protein VD971_06595 [Phycisphaerales bacterium]|nr:hypothetical protein [Phycisphaerales bacterium]
MTVKSGGDKTGIDDPADRMRAPGPVRRARKRFAIAAVSCYAAVIVAVPLALEMRGVGAWLLVFMFAWFPVVLCAVVFELWPTHRLAAKIRVTRGAVCWGCGYDLRRSALAGACPECGASYNAEDLARRWECHFDQSCIYVDGVRRKLCPRCSASVRGRPDEGCCDRCGGRVPDFYEGDGLNLDWRRWRMPDAPIQSVGAPVPIRRVIVAVFIIVSALFVLGVIAVGFANATYVPSARRMGDVWKYAAIAAFAAIPVALTGLALHVRRVRRAATVVAGAMCWRCLYDLRDLGERGVCPECASPFNRRVLARRWRAYIDPSVLLAEKAVLTRCLACGYDLAGLSADGACPECGGAYTHLFNDPAPRPPA